MTRSLSEVQQLDSLNDAFGIVSPTEMTTWKNVKKDKTEGSSLNLVKNRSGRSTTECTQENIIFFKKSSSKIQEYQLERMVWTFVIVHLTKPLNAI